MNIRAYLHKSKELYYPDNSSPRSMCEFYGVLQGYDTKGESWEINLGSGIKDKHGNEVYEKDYVEVHFKYRDGSEERVSGIVEYIAGCFNVNNDQALDLDLANCEGNLTIKNTVYDKIRST